MPTSNYYMTYDVDTYYNMMNVYKKRFKMMLWDDGMPVELLTEESKLTAFDLIDADHDGYVSLTEFRDWMTIARVGVTTPTLTVTDYDTIFGLLDVGDQHAGNYGAYDGKLSYEEFTNVIGVQYDW